MGENEAELVLTISDLLPHLAQKQVEKKLEEAVTAEDLNIIIGSRPGEWVRWIWGAGEQSPCFWPAIIMDVVDAGPAILSMHSPFEISSKIDIYAFFEAFKAFYGKL